MKKILFLFVCNFVLSEVCALDYTYQSYINIGSTIVIANNSRLRSKPDLTAGIIQTLPIGTKVTVIEKTDIETLINGKISNWYKVSFNDIVGYIWGGLIADSFIQSDFDSDGIIETLAVQRYVNENSVFERGLSFSVRWECIFTLIDGSAISHDKLFSERFIGFYEAKDITFTFDDSNLVLLSIFYSYGDGNAAETYSKLYHLEGTSFKALVQFQEYGITESDRTELQVMRISTEVRGTDRLIDFILEKEVIMGDGSKKEIIKTTTLKWDRSNMVYMH